MLVLSRKISEKIHIGDDIVITITGLRENRVRVGIQAPDNMLILRGELVVSGDEQSSAPPPQDSTSPVS